MPTRVALPGVLLAALLTSAQAQELQGHALLPAETFAEGPPSGGRLPHPLNGVKTPFETQPVQGFSALLPLGEGVYLALVDNGYGRLENSADFLLRVYRIQPQLKTAAGGEGTIRVLDSLTLRDPERRIPFPIVHEFTSARELTGADFDLESFQRAPDGSLWFGDEFGPFLLHTDSEGQVLEAPLPVRLDATWPELRSPQNPFLEESALLRVLNALAAHAARYGSPVPVLSPSDLLLDDGDLETGIATRMNPPQGSGLEQASSEVFSLQGVQAAGYSVVPYTVNEKSRMLELMRLGVNGLISDDPALLREAVEEFDADGDGTPGDFLLPDGLIDIDRFDAQGHRGGRDLRPENTLPAMEIALDSLMTTLETDTGITQDGVPVLSHEPYVSAKHFRRTNGEPYVTAQELLIQQLTLGELQGSFVGDKQLNSRPKQENALSLSPVAVAFARVHGLSDPYVIPTLAQLFEFVEYYTAHYREGEGAQHPQAQLRAKNAARVRFNVETKIDPQSEEDEKGRVKAERTAGPDEFALAVAKQIQARSLEARVDVQSFDLRTLLVLHEKVPQIRTIWLVGDYPDYPLQGDGTNLQNHGEKPTPWLAGMPWPYRQSYASWGSRLPASGGFEGMAQSPDGKHLYPMLEKPVEGEVARQLLIFEFSLEKRAFTPRSWRYPLDVRGSSIGAFQLFDRSHGLVIERDDSQGDLEGFKALFEVTLDPAGGQVEKRLLLDLLDLRDPHGLAAGTEGDVGVGKRYALPYHTIEALVVLDSRRVAILNDNNFPWSVGRHLGSGRPDDSEFVILGLPQALGGD